MQIIDLCSTNHLLAFCSDHHIRMMMNIIDHTKARTTPARYKDPFQIIIHNTGDTDAAKIIKYYTTPKSLCPHYVVDPSGTIHRIVPETNVAWHIAYNDAVAALYDKGVNVWKRWRKRNGALEETASDTYYDSWFARWPNVSDPRSIAGPKPNYSSVGIELVALRKPTERVFTDEQYIALQELIAAISVSCRIPIARQSVFGHSDADPISRFNNRGSWDPGAAFDWNAIYAAFGL